MQGDEFKYVLNTTNNLIRQFPLSCPSARQLRDTAAMPIKIHPVLTVGDG